MGGWVGGWMGGWVGGWVTWVGPGRAVKWVDDDSSTSLSSSLGVGGVGAWCVGRGVGEATVVVEIVVGGCVDLPSFLCGGG